MNLLEAIKSGKRYRRPGHTFWYENIAKLVEPGFTCVCFEYQDLMAEDWEIETECQTSTSNGPQP